MAQEPIQGGEENPKPFIVKVTPSQFRAYLIKNDRRIRKLRKLMEKMDGDNPVEMACLADCLDLMFKDMFEKALWKKQST